MSREPFYLIVYLNGDGSKATVVTAQWFDYADYEANLVINHHYSNKVDAEAFVAWFNQPYVGGWALPVRSSVKMEKRP